MISFTVEHLENFLMILVRISSLIFIAPFFSNNSVPRRFKMSLALFISIILFNILPYQPLEYNGVIGYGILILKESAVGLLLGLSANVCMSILAFAGQMIDIEIGFSMVSMFDPVTRTQTTITANLYTYLVTLIMIVTNMHFYIIKALISSFDLIPLGGIKIKPELYSSMLRFLTDYIVIGFRIILPVFSATLIVNIVLGILAKVAPQMSLFVIGMQIKIFLGLFIIFITIGLLPTVSEFISNEMKTMMILVIEGMS